MKNRQYAIVVLLVAASIAAIVWSRGGSQDFENFPPRATGPWVAFGDSLTEGYGVQSDDSYPATLSRQLGISITNHGKNGRTTASGLTELGAATKLNPRVVLLCLGGNDALSKVPLEKTVQNLSAIIDQFQANGSFVVLIGVRSGLLRDRYDKPFQRLAKEKGVFYIPDILEDVFGKPVYMADPIHPNAQGYVKIADRLDLLLRPLLPRLTSSDTGNGS